MKTKDWLFYMFIGGVIGVVGLIASIGGIALIGCDGLDKNEPDYLRGLYNANEIRISELKNR